MVVFTCNHCGDSLQKPRVEKHYTFACRAAKSLTCVDCFKDFHGEEYAVHTKCVTEEERYAKKGSLPNGVVKKGELKQESWTEMIKSIIDKEQNIQGSVKNLLVTISSYTNVPRKKPKFMNFIKNSSGGRVNLRDVESVWNLIEKHKPTPQNPQTNNTNINNNNNKNLSSEVQKEIKTENNERKRKNSETNGTTNGKSKKSKTEPEETDENLEKFSFQETILKILNKKESISVSKLQKKVLNEYLKFMELTEVSPKTIKKYNKKLKKIKNIGITDDTVKLIK